MQLQDLVDLCTAYDRLGWAVQDQLNKVLAQCPLGDLNPNAVGLLQDWLERAKVAADGGFTGAGDQALVEEIEEVQTWIEEEREAMEQEPA
jgi:hypothetical protein